MRVAVAQIEPRLGERERNVELILVRLEEAAGGGAELVVFPECAVSGYMFASPEEAARHAEEVPGPATAAIGAACARLGVHCVFGLLERSGDALHNAAQLVGPDGFVGAYRKSHLPYLGVDRFVVPGAEADVFETPLGRIAIEICYDLRFPELTRTLALKGADVVAHPTNWPLAARPNADFYTRTRAAENRIYLLTANRVGRERWAEFCGWSQVCDPTGTRLAEADATEEGIFLADVDLALAREKDLLLNPGEYEMRLFDDRRPKLYQALVETPVVTT